MKINQYNNFLNRIFNYKVFHKNKKENQLNKINKMKYNKIKKMKYIKIYKIN